MESEGHQLQLGNGLFPKVDFIESTDETSKTK